MVLKLSRSMNSSASREPSLLARSIEVFQVHEQLPAIRQVGQRIVIREVVQLARALVDLRFQLDLVRAHGALRMLQLFGHLVERDGQHVELADPGARHSRADCTACETTRRVDQAAHRRGHARHGDDRDHDQQQHDGSARPNQLPIGLVGGAAPPAGQRPRARAAPARPAASRSVPEISAPLSRNSIERSLKSSMALNAARRPAMTVARLRETSFSHGWPWTLASSLGVLLQVELEAVFGWRRCPAPNAATTCSPRR